MIACIAHVHIYTPKMQCLCNSMIFKFKRRGAQGGILLLEIVGGNKLPQYSPCGPQKLFEQHSTTRTAETVDFSGKTRADLSRA